MSHVPLFVDFITGSGILEAPTHDALNRLEMALKEKLELTLPATNHEPYTTAELSSALCDWADLLTTASRVSTCPDVPHDYSDMYTLANAVSLVSPHHMVRETAYQLIRHCHTHLHIAVCLRFNQLRRMEGALLEQQVQFAGIFGMNQPMALA